MKHKKSHLISTLFLMVVAFAAGFAFHSFFFPNIKAEDLPKYISKQKVLNGVTEIRSIGGKQKDDDFITAVVYKNGSFSPNKVKIKRGNYITITNQEKENQIWLESNEQLLTTKRGYAESEQIKTTLNEPGTYIVTNKLKPDAKLEVTVE